MTQSVGSGGTGEAKKFLVGVVFMHDISEDVQQKGEPESEVGEGEGTEMTER